MLSGAIRFDMDHAIPIFSEVIWSQHVVPCEYLCWYNYDTVCLKFQEHPTSTSKTINESVILQHIARVVGINGLNFDRYTANQASHTTWYIYIYICRETAEKKKTANWAKWWTSLTECHNTTALQKGPCKGTLSEAPKIMVIPSFFLVPGTSKSRLCRRVPGNRKSATLDPPSTFHDAS